MYIKSGKEMASILGSYIFLYSSRALRDLYPDGPSVPNLHGEVGEVCNGSLCQAAHVYH